MRRIMRHTAGTTAVLGVALAAASANAAMSWWTGFDAGAGPSSARPLASAADAAWTSAAGGIGAIQICDFELLALNSTAVPTVNLTYSTSSPNATYSAPAGHGLKVLDTTTQDVANGFNVTSGGNMRVSMVEPWTGGGPLTYTFYFPTPVQAFGCYITGEGVTAGGSTLSMQFSDSMSSFALPVSTQMGARFVGFVDPGESVSTITLVLGPAITQPFVSIDDVRWVYATDDPNSGGDCTGDLNGDAAVNLTDLAILLANFGGIGGTGQDGDVNGDGMVNLMDLAMLLARFGVRCP